MKKDKLSDVVSNVGNYGRRRFLSLSALAGTIFLLNGKGQASSAFNEDGVDSVEDVKLADTLALYTSFLDEVRRVVLQLDVIEIQEIKLTASEIWGDMIDLAEQYTQNPSTERAERLAERTKMFKDEKKRFDEMRTKKLTDIKELDKKIDGIRADMLEAGRILNNAENSSAKINNKSQKINEAKTKIDVAISKLNDLKPIDYFGSVEIKNALNDELMTPAKLAALLQKIKEATFLPAKSIDNKKVAFLPASYPHSVTNSSSQAFGISEILKNYIRPATWFQLKMGVALVKFILATTSEKEARKKLLRDPLRALGSLLPDDREKCAEALASLKI